MKKIIPCLVIMLLMSFSGFGQDKMVSLDYQNNIFNNNQALPSGEYFTIKGDIPYNISMVSLAVYKNDKRKNPLFEDKWRRPMENVSETFMIPFNYKLHGNREYDFVFHFYRQLDDVDKKALAQAVRQNLKTYIDGAVDAEYGKVKLHASVKTIINQMDQLVKKALTFYKSPLLGSFPGFSQVVENKLKHPNYQGDSEHYAQELLTAGMSEIQPYLNGEVMVLADVREVRQYPTEETSHYIALNVGYGGVYIDGEWDDMDYDSAPYLGVTIPLGDQRYSSFWGNTALSFGVFLKDFKDEDGNTVTGPVVGKPYFVGLGYKFLHIFRLQAGVVATSTEKIDHIQDVEIKDFNLRPFVGLSAEINLWVGFDKNKK